MTASDKEKENKVKKSVYDTDGKQRKEKSAKKDKIKPLTRVVIRRLPPIMTEEDFLKQIDPLPEYDSYYFVPADWSLGFDATCRAYINFASQDDVFWFKDRFDGYVFVDNKGAEYPAIVEFAAFQGLPKAKCRKNDLKCNTIEHDPHYKKFLKKLEDEENDEAAKIDLKLEIPLTSKKDKKNMSTPLLQYLANKKQEKKEERKRKAELKKRMREEEKRIKKIQVATTVPLSIKEEEINKRNKNISTSASASSMQNKEKDKDFESRDKDFERRDKNSKQRDKESEHRDKDSKHRDKESEHRDKDFERRDKDSKHRDKESEHRDRDFERRDRDSEHRDRDSEHRDKDSEHRDKDSEHRDKDFKHRDKDSERCDKDSKHRDKDSEHRDKDFKHRDKDPEYRDRVFVRRDRIFERRNKDSEHHDRDFERRDRDSKHRDKDSEYRDRDFERRDREVERRNKDHERYQKDKYEERKDSHIKDKLDVDQKRKYHNERQNTSSGSSNNRSQDKIDQKKDDYKVKINPSHFQDKIDFKERRGSQDNFIFKKLEVGANNTQQIQRNENDKQSKKKYETVENIKKESQKSNASEVNANVREFFANSAASAQEKTSQNKTEIKSSVFYKNDNKSEKTGNAANNMKHNEIGDRKSEDRTSRRIRNKDRPSIEIYQPGKMRLNSKRDERNDRSRSDYNRENRYGHSGHSGHSSTRYENENVNKECNENNNVVKKKVLRYSEQRLNRARERENALLLAKESNKHPNNDEISQGIENKENI